MDGQSADIATSAAYAGVDRPAAKQKSAGGLFSGRRAKKPRALALITDACTGCAGAPVCQPYCPVDECMILLPAEDAYPYGRIWVDPLKCIGCRKCTTRGPEGLFLDGCPWDAIAMVPTGEWEQAHGVMPF
ncbi:MAG: 4Fe-4S ferredoxin [Candidatus Binatia bacterium]